MSTATDPLSAVLTEVEAELRPSVRRVRDAENRAQRLIDELHRGGAWMYEVKEVLSHGSISRGTGLRHFKDLDKLIVLDAEALRTRRGAMRTPRDTISRMSRAIEDRRAGLVGLGSISIRSQDHSVGIRYRSGVRIDLVPAIRAGQRLLIPESGSNEWLRTNPAETAGLLQRAERRLPHAPAGVRLAKGWARARGHHAPLPGYAIETLVVASALREMLSLGELVARFLADIAHSKISYRLVMGDGPVAGPIAVWDPVSDANLTEELDKNHRKRLIEAARRGLEDLGRIEATAAKGRHARAVSAARKLFLGSWADG